jgi:hypothetical protein
MLSVDAGAIDGSVCKLGKFGPRTCAVFACLAPVDLHHSHLGGQRETERHHAMHLVECLLSTDMLLAPPRGNQNAVAGTMA